MGVLSYRRMFAGSLTEALQLWCHSCGRVHWRAEWQERGWTCPTPYCHGMLPRASEWDHAAETVGRSLHWPVVADDSAYYPFPGSWPTFRTGSLMYVHSPCPDPERAGVKRSTPAQ